ncbi:MAG: hypothetical protein ACI9OJ_002069, partial [Myxococcota bacterium]
VLLAAGLVAVIAVRTLILPPLGWDSVTYHGVKVGEFLQTQGAVVLDTPGGFHLYRLFPDGAEILTAWTALPFSSDLLTGLGELLQWLLLWPALRGLARELKVDEKLAPWAVLHVMSLPTVIHMLGGGYVEPARNLMVACGAFLLVRGIRLISDDPVGRPFIVTGLGAFGMAAAIKVPEFPLAFVSGLILLVFCVRRSVHRWPSFAMAGLGTTLVFVLPWMIRGIRSTGFPLSPFPISVGGLTLGTATPNTVWYGQRPDLLPTSLDKELEVLRTVFDFQTLDPIGLGFVTFVMVLALPLTLMRFGRTSAAGAGVLAVVALAPLVAFYHPGFTVVRLGWTISSARFLWATAAIGTLLASAMLPVRFRRSASVLLGTMALWFLATPLLSHVHTTEVSALWLGVPVLLVIAFGLVWVAGAFEGVRTSLIPVVAIIGLASTLPWLQGVADARRAVATDWSRFAEPITTHWAKSAALIDDPAIPRVVAIAGGAAQTYDNEMMYFFMGRRFQNRLVYVAPTADAAIQPFDSDAGYPKEQLSYPAWVQGLQDNNVDFVMTFLPETPEATWMTERRDQFEPVFEVAYRWGLYRFRSESIGR